jgi:hypothetical protein
MKNVLAGVASIVVLTVLLAAPAAAQGICFVAEPGLTLQQWYQICQAQVAQTCSVLPMQGPACIQSVAQAEYRSYQQQQNLSMACQPYQAGLRQCINGYVATCNGSMFMTSAQQC